MKDKRHLGVIARLPSIISGRRPVEVCHVRYGDLSRGKPPTGMGQKPDDKWVLPLTPDEHRLGRNAQHAGNERDWWRRHGIDPLAACEELYAVWKIARTQMEAEELMESIVLRIMAFKR